MKWKNLSLRRLKKDFAKKEMDVVPIIAYYNIVQCTYICVCWFLNQVLKNLLFYLYCCIFKRIVEPFIRCKILNFQVVHKIE